VTDEFLARRQCPVAVWLSAEKRCRSIQQAAAPTVSSCRTQSQQSCSPPLGELPKLGKIGLRFDVSTIFFHDRQPRSAPSIASQSSTLLLVKDKRAGPVLHLQSRSEFG
jgi:hypothetical protein